MLRGNVTTERNFANIATVMIFFLNSWWCGSPVRRFHVLSCSTAEQASAEQGPYIITSLVYAFILLWLVDAVADGNEKLFMNRSKHLLLPEKNFLRKGYTITAALSKLLWANQCDESFLMFKFSRTVRQNILSTLVYDKPDQPCLWYLGAIAAACKVVMNKAVDSSSSVGSSAFKLAPQLDPPDKGEG